MICLLGGRYYLGSQPEVLSINPATFDGLANLLLIAINPSAIYMTVALHDIYQYRQHIPTENNVRI